MYNYNIHIGSISRDDYYFETWYESLVGTNSNTPISDRWKGIPIPLSQTIYTPIYNGGGRYPYPPSIEQPYYYVNIERYHYHISIFC